MLQTICPIGLPKSQHAPPTRSRERTRIAKLLTRARMHGDPGVPELIRDLERAGVRVKNVNMGVQLSKHSTVTDIEVVLEKVLLQVKKTSSATKLSDQIERTKAISDYPVLGYVLSKNKAGVRTVQGSTLKGHTVTNDFNQLLEWVR